MILGEDPSTLRNRIGVEKPQRMRAPSESEDRDCRFSANFRAVSSIRWFWSDSSTAQPRMNYDLSWSPASLGCHIPGK